MELDVDPRMCVSTRLVLELLIYRSSAGIVRGRILGAVTSTMHVTVMKGSMARQLVALELIRLLTQVEFVFGGCGTASNHQVPLVN